MGDKSTLGQASNKIIIQGANISEDVKGLGVDGIALSPHGDKLYYSSPSGFALNSINATLLRDFSSSAADLSASVVYHGDMPSNTDGISFSADGDLFFTGPTADAVFRWRPEATSVADASVVARSAMDLWWPDTLAFDNKGFIYSTSNRLSSAFFPPPKLNITGTDVNFRIVKVYVGAKSYMCAQAGVRC